MITARDGDIDDLVDERVGAHDYLSKPVSVKELRARATALQARLVVPSDAPARAGDAPLDLGSGLVVRAAEQQVVLGEQTVPLTPIEVEVLATLARRKGEPCSRQELAASVWAGEFVESDYLVDVAVGGIRTKLRRAGSRARWIDAVDGTSYVLRPAV
ncbi:MAG: hypothetical protein CMH83_02355 [Nocardioides sp.]|nr:hypothetical protein [Nocardioides sp.]